MQKELTSEDKAKIKKTNLFRFSKEWYSTANFVAIFCYGYSFFMPYFGWRRKPTHIPINFNEYIKDVLELFLIFSPIAIFPISNFIIKKIELSKNFKIETGSKIIFKRKIIAKLKIVVFKPFSVFFYINTLKYNDIEENDQILIEKTSCGRILNYAKTT